MSRMLADCSKKQLVNVLKRILVTMGIERLDQVWYFKTFADLSDNMKFRKEKKRARHRSGKGHRVTTHN